MFSVFHDWSVQAGIYCTLSTCKSKGTYFHIIESFVMGLSRRRGAGCLSPYRTSCDDSTAALGRLWHKRLQVLQADARVTHVHTAQVTCWSSQMLHCRYTKTIHLSGTFNLCFAFIGLREAKGAPVSWTSLQLHTKLLRCLPSCQCYQRATCRRQHIYQITLLSLLTSNHVSESAEVGEVVAPSGSDWMLLM